MITSKRHITVFEHESLRTDRGENRLSQSEFKALEVFFGEKGVPYYSLIYKGVKFNSYVGVLQVGNTVIEILPKADKNGDTRKWRGVLIKMLHAVGVFDVHAPSSSSLNLKQNSILDLYFQLYIKEIESLVHRGLVRQYRKHESNQTALKGSLHFSRHTQQNLVHKERFYVRHMVYDKDHRIHQILYKGLRLLSRINTDPLLASRIATLEIDFPEVQDIQITERLFTTLSYSRKTEVYRNAIEIARLLLLNYHPDVNRGRDDVLALMFDMNTLWEQFVYVSLRKHKEPGTIVRAQSSKYFWKPTNGSRTSMRPDILIKQKATGDSFVLDTKWKNISDFNPSPDDLRQLYVYGKYFRSSKVALVYPGTKSVIRSGQYYQEEDGQLGESECSVIMIPVEEDVKVWIESISENINNWIKSV